jgi:hypothetical protein
VNEKKWLSEVKASQERREITDGDRNKFEVHSKVAMYALNVYDAAKMVPEDESDPEKMKKMSRAEQALALGIQEKVNVKTVERCTSN